MEPDAETESADKDDTTVDIPLEDSAAPKLDSAEKILPETEEKVPDDETKKLDTIGSNELIYKLPEKDEKFLKEQSNGEEEILAETHSLQKLSEKINSGVDELADWEIVNLADQGRKKSDGRKTKDMPKKTLNIIDELTAGLTDSEIEKFQKHKNPFKLPVEVDIFTYKEREAIFQHKIRQENLQLPASEKTTKNSRYHTLRSKVTDILADPNVTEKKNIYKKTLADVRKRREEAAEDVTKQGYKLDTDPVYALAVTRKNRYIYKESKWELRDRVRDMALRNFTMWVKREQIRKLQRSRRTEEKRIEAVEARLERDAEMFDMFLKENDRLSVEAIKEAEIETRKKQELVTQSKFIASKIVQVKGQVHQLNDRLQELQSYARFLKRVIPKKWKPLIAAKEKERVEKLEKRSARIQKLEEEKDPTYLASKAAKQAVIDNLNTEINKLMDEATTVATPKTFLQKTIDAAEAENDEDVLITGLPPVNQHYARNSLDTADFQIMAKLEEKILLEEDILENVPPLVFQSPKQLLWIFAELESRSLRLINSSQDIEDEREAVKQRGIAMKKKLEEELAFILNQTSVREERLEKFQKQKKELEMKVKLFSHGEYNSEAQEALLNESRSKVEKVYMKVIGENEAHLNAEQILLSLENHLEMQLEKFEAFPPELLEAVQTIISKSRRAEERAKKVREEKLAQEERIRRAIQRSMAAPKRIRGRPLMFRSKPVDAGPTKAEEEKSSESEYDDYYDDIEDITKD